MPLYEYKCQACGDVFEVIQKFSDSPLTRHESCGGSVERLLSSPALQFKGSGWYITDYAKGSGKSTESNGSGEKKSETKTESKSGSAPASNTSTGSSTTDSK